MERGERQRLSAVQRQLQRLLSTVNELIKTAQAPKKLSDAQIKKRAFSIVAAIKKKGGSASADQLRQIVTKHGMPFSAVGSLVAGGYLRKNARDFVIRTGHQSGI